MARRPSPVRRTTLHRLRAVSDLNLCISRKYRNDDKFTLESVAVDGLECLLATGTIEKDSADWCPVLSNIAGKTVELGNITAAALLLVPLQSHTYALTYGFGHLFLEQELLDQGFGLSFAIRAVDPETLRQVTRHLLSERARIDRNSVPGGQRVQDFGIEEYGEIVSRVVGRSSDEELTINRTRRGTVDGPKSFSITASDSLKVPIGKTPSDAVSDLRIIAQIAESPSIIPELDFIGQMRPLRSKDPRNGRLDQLLADSFDSDGQGIALAYPWEQDVEQADVESYKIRIRGDERIVTDLDINDFVEMAGELSLDSRVPDLRKGYVQAFSDENATPDNAVSRQIPAIKWFAFDVTLDYERFFLHQGRWYEIGNQYAHYLTQRVTEILDRDPELRLPQWRKRSNGKPEPERDYNTRVASEENGFVNLDRKMIRTEMHPRGFESCDLVGPRGQLIHVKQADSSEPLSHLFAQGLVAAEQLLFDKEARRKLHELCRSAGKPLDDDWRLQSLHFGICLPRKGHVSVSSLFTFAQVMLVRCVNRLEGLDVPVRVISIEPHD